LDRWQNRLASAAIKLSFDIVPPYSFYDGWLGSSLFEGQTFQWTNWTVTLLIGNAQKNECGETLMLFSRLGNSVMWLQANADLIVRIK
jgi:hypothetical protein